MSAGWVEALAVTTVLAAVAIGFKLVRPSAAVGGILVGTLIYAGAGRGGFAVLVAFFTIGVALTRLGFREKAKRGLAEPNEGRRGSAHALANGGAAALAAIGMLVWPEWAPLLSVFFGGAFAAALSDTSGSEIGQLWGRRPISPITFRPVTPGTEGAVSLEGTFASWVAAAVIGAVATLTGLVDLGGGVSVAVGGAVGSGVESVAGSLGATRRLGHMALNVSNTVVGGLAAVGCHLLWGT